MINPDCPAEWLAERVSFDYLGGRHEGRGSLRWSPEKGFALEAELTRMTPLPGGQVGIGHVGLIAKKDYRTVRMRLRGGARAVTMPLPLIDRFDVLWSGRLSLAFPVAVIFESNGPKPEGPRWHGNAILRTAERLDLPRMVETRTRLGRRTVEHRVAAQGFDLAEPRSLQLSGLMVGDDRLRISWSLPRARRNRARLWRVPAAVRNALTALYGQDIGLSGRQITRGVTRITEYRVCHEIRSLGVFGPFYDQQVSEELLLRLVLFFLDKPKEEWICSHMCQQMFDAFSQRTAAATELLMSTILEAALRSWEGRPFRSGEKYSVDSALKRFRERYLGKAWRRSCSHAVEVFRRLRHRNAHPDWLTRPGGGLSVEEAHQSTADTLFLSRFYGYMMLALAGANIAEPRFPAGTD